MKKPVVSNIMFKLIALVLAVITWFYISAEMKQQKLGPSIYSPNKK